METELTEKQLTEEICRLAPFHHRVDLPFGLSTYVPEASRRPIEYTRLSNLVTHAFPTLTDVCGGSLKGKRILDVACNCGGFSVEAVKRGAEYVFGFDTVDRYIEQANFIKSALNLPKVEFKVMDIDRVDIGTIGSFDVTFCFGILYHLENPISAMKRLSSVTQQAILVDTDLEVLSYKRRPFCGFFGRKPFWLMNMPPIVTPESASATTSLWRRDRVVQFRPNDSAVVELLKFLGFGRVIKINPKSKGLEQRYYTGARGTFLGVRT